ncbi:MAG: CRISPR-associated helicase Cas3' [Paenibacillus macerans]|uniref:CRISPR-associated helicase Cas3' n=1 Tax=Paenibacillus TaxID=44249 RepID=UPI001F0D098D|nr:CRISPR-associated helicase Cas3' [Paenibacillus macerans]MDU7474716.1 CRISPR-associated helicase Cas3' [Paenibacillus macerans]UMV49131.1 CRISPR-associated helicase Cas3' [Paenibacillus macerans]
MNYAHSKRDPLTKELLPKSEWHPLDWHHQDTADMAAKFAGYFGCSSFGRILGQNHDYGKASLDFQMRLNGATEPVDHKTAGTLLVHRHYPFPYGLMMAYAVYGHHGGLPNHISTGTRTGLEQVLKQDFQIIGGAPPILPELEVSSVPMKGNNSGMGISLWIRMLYSALIDADYLDAERYFQPLKTELRNNLPSLSELHAQFHHKLQELLHKPQNSNVLQARHYVLESCLLAGTGSTGLYTLTAPTGSGKTWASLAFALKHAEQHSEMRRIIVALPFTSLIEQTAGLFREVFGEEAVLEHHSNVSYRPDSESEFSPKQLASENWEASLIVTTHVQLFESLFSAKPSKARKLHRLAGSIIILDEAQALPADFLEPSLAALKCLCDNYGVTVLFCTATQLAFQPKWLGGVAPTEIIGDPTSLYRKLKRVTVSTIGKKTNVELVERLNSHQRALCIVNSRKQASDLYKQFPDKEGVFHLSGLMCAQHRSQILQAISDRLKMKKTRCIVVSTSLIEAGVDLDFPVVYREIAGVDSIAQAAGRGNREGELELGHVFIFESADYPLRDGWFKTRAQITQAVLNLYPDPLEPEAIRYYFQLAHGMDRNLDVHHILGDLNAGASQCSFQFREISEKYKFIETEMVPVVIPYDLIAIEHLNEIKNSLHPVRFSRELQRYTVSVYPNQFERLRQASRIGTLHETIHYLTSVKGGIDEEIQDFYSKKTGLII